MGKKTLLYSFTSDGLKDRLVKEYVTSVSCPSLLIFHCIFACLEEKGEKKLRDKAEREIWH